jgi:hypothetical protein
LLECEKDEVMFKEEEKFKQGDETCLLKGKNKKEEYKQQEKNNNQAFGRPCYLKRTKRKEEKIVKASPPIFTDRSVKITTCCQKEETNKKRKKKEEKKKGSHAIAFIMSINTTFIL